MSKAITKAGVPVNASDENPESEERQRRLCIKCGVAVTHRQAHVQEHDGIARDIRAHFVQKRNKPHLPSCGFRVDNVVEALAADSDALAIDGQTLIHKLSQGCIEFRLHVLTDAIKLFEAPASNSTSSEAASNARRSNGNTLQDYISKAAQVLALHFAIEDHADRDQFHRRVTIVEKGRKIRWADFLYDNDRYQRLHDEAMNGPVQHSVAMIVSTKAEKAGAIKKTLRCGRQKVSETIIAIPSLIEAGKGTLSGIGLGRWYIAVGTVTANTGEAKGVTFLNINMNIAYASQIWPFPV
jgi:hypothetical protein